jgi:hypothetical protein
MEEEMNYLSEKILDIELELGSLDIGCRGRARSYNELKKRNG